MTLKSRAKSVQDSAIVAQRLKRLSSIELKLSLHEHMKLSQMQDIGGCRAVMSTVREVDQLVEKYKESERKNPHTKERSELISEDDYISHPKKDGYRSYHLIYKYRTTSPAYCVYNSLRIEIQLRSRLQHAWATAVETISTFTGQAYKSNIGEDDWKRFFALMGSAIARRERRPLIPGTPDDEVALSEELREAVSQLNVMMQLRAWGTALETTTSRQVADLYLLELDPTAMNLTITGYDATDMDRANSAYLEAERRLEAIPGAQAVLVSADSMGILRKAYPNYFLDTTAFLDAVQAAIAPVKKKTKKKRD